MNSTVWYKSKTLWFGIIALIASIAQKQWGLVIDGPTQGVIASIIFIILRLETHGSVTASKPAEAKAEEAKKNEDPY